MPGLRVLILESAGAYTLKSGPQCKYFYTKKDCGLNQKKGRGSLTKLPGRTGTHGLGPLDLDLVAQI